MLIKKPLIPFRPTQTSDMGTNSSQPMRPNFLSRYGNRILVKHVSSLEFPSKDVPLKPCNSVIADEQNSHNENDVVKSEAPIQPVDTYSHLLHFPPLKQVPVGPQYQADIPEWHGFDPNNASKTSNENKFIGSCVIQMPDSAPPICNGVGKSHCWCEDPGSVICVRLHIIEARENLRENIGHERFSELGFCNMGDMVACKWTEEDEQLFHEVVYSNPVSLGQNFWNHLADAFPSRTNGEIVSYYFNVFVLQRRAEQNRFDPMNADSDDDEWQGSSESSEEDEVSNESPVFYYNEESEFIHGYNQTLIDESGDNSCTSSESQVSEVNHDFMLEPSDSREWDVGYFSFPRNKADFLPTGSMIEEVFGVESWKSDNEEGSS
ncbi:unnamed protein product [Lactuca virosa]|uniref:Myb-like domain-containing protein n=1 Tax=Lactuca virosa TaxID=75947 RepID=A0AAU9MVW0_9ASTR|nr:unnamed protein product [Lactuca virosa]